MYRCVFILRDGASRADARALGKAIYRLRLETVLRKQASRRRVRRRSKQPRERISRKSKRLPEGRLEKCTTMPLDMRMCGWPEELYPVGIDANTKHAKLLRSLNPPPPVCRVEMIHILYQYLPLSVLEDVLVDGQSWSKI